MTAIDHAGQGAGPSSERVERTQLLIKMVDEAASAAYVSDLQQDGGGSAYGVSEPLFDAAWALKVQAAAAGIPIQVDPGLLELRRAFDAVWDLATGCSSDELAQVGLDWAEDRRTGRQGFVSRDGAEAVVKAMVARPGKDKT